jgi:hypothetical protein
MKNLLATLEILEFDPPKFRFKFLSYCLLVYIEKKIAKIFSLDAIINDFDSMKDTIEYSFVELKFC